MDVILLLVMLHQVLQGCGSIVGRCYSVLPYVRPYVGSKVGSFVISAKPKIVRSSFIFKLSGNASVCSFCEVFGKENRLLVNQILGNSVPLYVRRHGLKEQQKYSCIYICKMKEGDLTFLLDCDQCRIN